jgi:hypothetical protein
LIYSGSNTLSSNYMCMYVHVSSLICNSFPVTRDWGRRLSHYTRRRGMYRKPTQSFRQKSIKHWSLLHRNQWLVTRWRPTCLSNTVAMHITCGSMAPRNHAVKEVTFKSSPFRERSIWKFLARACDIDISEGHWNPCTREKGYILDITEYHNFRISVEGTIHDSYHFRAYTVGYSELYTLRSMHVMTPSKVTNQWQNR